MINFGVNHQTKHSWATIIEDFKHMTILGKVIATVVSPIFLVISVLTLGCFAKSMARSFVNQFKKIEDSSPETQSVAKKTDSVALNIFNLDDEINFSAPSLNDKEKVEEKNPSLINKEIFSQEDESNQDNFSISDSITQNVAKKPDLVVVNLFNNLDDEINYSASISQSSSNNKEKLEKEKPSSTNKEISSKNPKTNQINSSVSNPLLSMSDSSSISSREDENSKDLLLSDEDDDPLKRMDKENRHSNLNPQKKEERINKLEAQLVFEEALDQDVQSKLMTKEQRIAKLKKEHEIGTRSEQFAPLFMLIYKEMENNFNCFDEVAFIKYLKAALSIAVFREAESYEVCLENFRKKNCDNELKNTAHLMYTQEFLDVADFILSKLMFENNNLNPEFSTKSLRINLEKLKNAPPEYKAGPFLVAYRKFLAKFNGAIQQVDFNGFGNTPGRIGVRAINDQSVTILRHAVPTLENGDVEIAPEYKFFLENLKNKNQKVLYCCLLNPTTNDEEKRITALRSLEDEFPETFHFVRFPLDGPLYKTNTTFEEYTKKVEKSFSDGIEGKSTDFIFSTSVIKTLNLEKREKIFSLALMMADKVKDLNDSEKNKVFLLLVSAFTRDVCMKELGISFYNNSCKDAIDRGAVHLFTDLVLQSLLNTSKEENALDKNARNIALSTYYPAFFAKSQAVLEDRAEWIFAFSKWAEGLKNANSTIEDLNAKCEEQLKLSYGPLIFARSEQAFKDMNNRLEPEEA